MQKDPVARTPHDAMRHAQDAELLCAAIDQRDLSRCIELLDAGADPNARENDDGRTPLEHSIIQSFPEAAILLLQRGAAITAQGPNGWIALHLAARYGEVEVCRAILERGGCVDARDRSGSTALLDAIGMNRIDACRFLIERGANVNAATVTGHTILREAVISCRPGSFEILKMVISYGADQRAVVSDAFVSVTMGPLTAFQWAVAYGKTAVVAFLIDEFGEDPNQITIEGTSMIDLAPDGALKELIRAAITERSARLAIEAPDPEPDTLDPDLDSQKRRVGAQTFEAI